MRVFDFAFHANLLCRILESKGAYFVEHPMVEEEVDSAASRILLSRRALDAEAVLGTHVITPKHIINYHRPLTFTRTKRGLAWDFKYGAIKEKMRTLQISGGIFKSKTAGPVQLYPARAPFCI